MSKVELLSPAGDFDCLKAAVSNGANAVYLGGKNFSARAFAGNFDEDGFLQAIRYAHLRDVKIYVTLNTLLDENQLENALKMADFYYKANVDGILIQDLGLFYILKQRYPDLDLHCSTQMHIHNVEGVRNAKQLGFSRVVMARESTLDLIRKACECGIEVETFVHGAICVSYSGQCLMSSVSKSRSANKGMCAQCCRLKYRLYDEKHHSIKTETEYLLSPKDMFLLEDIPDLIEAGVSCFKIEGRMKSPAYVGYITRMYREAIDAYYENREFRITQKELDNMKVLFNRGFTNALLRGEKDLFGQKTPNHLGIPIGKVKEWKKGMCYLLLERDLHQFDGIRIGDFGCIVNMLYKDGLLVKEGRKGEIVSIKTDSPLKGVAYKTQDHLLEEEILKRPEKKVSLSMTVRLMPGEDASVLLRHGDVSYLFRSEIPVENAKSHPLDEEKIKKQFEKLNETVYESKRIEIESENAFLAVSELNRLRREAIDAFDTYRLNGFHRTFTENKYPYKELEPEDQNPRTAIQQDEIMHLGESEYSIDPVINPSSNYKKVDKCVVSEFGGILRECDDKMAYFTLNCSNSYAYEFLKKLGFTCVCLSTELNDRQIDDLIAAYEKRNGTRIRPFVLKKGNRVLMYIASDPFGDYVSDRKKNYYLSDGNREYLVRFEEGITKILENEDRERTMEESWNELIIND